MNITFLGGAETVTGSKFLIEAGETRVLVDCGLFQGYKWLRKRNRQPLPLDIESLDAVLLTHAHLDHSVYIPVLYKQGFRGAVVEKVSNPMVEARTMRTWTDALENWREGGGVDWKAW